MKQPTPTKDETVTTFMSRCMDDATMQAEYPDPEERANACAIQWRADQVALSRWIGRALTYPVVTGMIVLVGLSGCSTAQMKGEAYERAAAKFAYPEKVRICYTREGETQTGTEHRCFGQDCVLPECPQ